MNRKVFPAFFFLVLICFGVIATTKAQQATVTARLDGAQIVVGDRARLFIEAQQPGGTNLAWAAIPDTFNSLEVVERGPIDTVAQNGLTVYKQRLLITGFASGLFKIPSFTFTAIPQGGSAYTVNTDSFALSVSTVPVDTTQAFKPIKGIMAVKGSWLDYIWYILLGAAFVAVITAVVFSFRKGKKIIPVATAPQKTLQQKTLEQLQELEQQQLWQKVRVKEYYIALTDILRVYLEARFKVKAMEQTTDELLEQAQRSRELVGHTSTLATILQTADLAKFAKAQPLPAEHTAAMELTKQFVQVTPSLPQNPETITTSS